jgi:hypothetical protein
MQRVRIGMIGLASVFLLVLLAAVFSRASDEEPITANAIEQHMAANGMAEEAAEPKEPLAELGVAPGASTPTPKPQMTGNPPMLTLSPPAPVLPNPSNTAAPAQH